MIREYGWKNRISKYPGRNSRLDEIQAAILRVKLKYLDLDNEKRRFIANYYASNLQNYPINLPLIRENVEAVFHLFVIQVEDRKKLLSYLLKKGVQAGIHYPVPVHLQPSYKGRLKTSSNMNITETLADKIISLPIYPELSLDNAEIVTDSIKNFYQ